MADGQSAKFMKNAHIGWTNGSYYYPPDFDYKKLAAPKDFMKHKQRGVQTMGMRMMMPFTMVCETCGEYMYIGTKFNSRCEKIKGGNYYGVATYRFTGKCKSCVADFTFRTDHETSGYILETGGKRQYEAMADAEIAVEKVKEDKEARKDDAMQALEDKRIDMEREMHDIDALERLIEMGKRGARAYDMISFALDKLFGSGADGKVLDAVGIEVTEQEQSEIDAFKEAQDKKEERLLDGPTPSSTIEARKRLVEAAVASSSLSRAKPKVTVKRKATQDGEPLPKRQTGAPKEELKEEVDFVKVERRVKEEPPAVKTECDSANAAQQNEPSGNGLGMLGSYGSDSDST
mmetsp:Transcript_29417/g.75317  ORF Transcript_29417/g.75317 Transcript_29417/m.75317 type:complete len:347 (-) Transcript_29417:51-1091(-)